MVPDIAKKGHSFNGAFLYYLHDKRHEMQGESLTAERVAWTETRNLVTDDPELARRVMIATAQQAGELKAAAGVKATGRKSNQHVYAFALSWHPDEAAKLGRGDMARAADAALKALEAEHLQAVIVCHQDTAHPHLHVILNRVDPATGKMHGFSKDREKLSAWAAAYERERGQILTPARQQKHAPEKAPIQTAPQPPEKTRAAALFERAAVQKVRHKQEWADLAAANKARRAAVYGERIDYKAIAADHRAQTRPQWSELGKELAAERKAFRSREKQFPGLVRNALALAHIRIGQADTERRGLLSETFRLILDRHARHAEFEAWAQNEKAKLAATLNNTVQERFTAAKAERAVKLAAISTTYTRARAELITRQDLEKAKIRDEWKGIYAEREKAAQLVRHADHGRGKMTRQNGQNYRHGRRFDRAILRPPQQEIKPVKPDFQRAAQLPVATQSPIVAPVRRMSVSVPEPAPAPGGVPTPPARRMEPVPERDRAAAYAKTTAGAKATAPQKAAPDALRRSFRPPENVASAKEQETPREAGRPAARDYWNRAAGAASEQPKPAERRGYWDKEPTREKPATAAPRQGKARDDWERDR